MVDRLENDLSSSVHLLAEMNNLIVYM